MSKLKLEKDVSRTQNSRQRKSKHSEFHDEVSKLLQDACLRDSFVVEGKDRIASLINKKNGSFKTKNGHVIYFSTQTVEKANYKNKSKRLTRFFVKNIAEKLPDGEWPWGSTRWDIKNFKECPCQDCRTQAEIKEYKKANYKKYNKKGKNNV